MSKKSPLTPPFSRDAEMSVLGAMLSDSTVLSIAADLLSPEDFYLKEHQIIFSALKEAYKKDRPSDLLLISEELKRLGHFEAVGGASYLTTLVQHAGTAAHIEEYAEIVKNKSILRRMAIAASQIGQKALSEPEDVQSALDEAQSLFFQISQTTLSSYGVLLKELLLGTRGEAGKSYLKQIEERQSEFLQKGEKVGDVTGIPTQLTDLDKMINGLGPSQLLILAARPSMGKTALALNIAENVAIKSEMPVAVFSLEMNAEELVHRLICSQSEVESDAIRTGRLTGTQYQKIVAAVDRLKKGTLVIDDSPGLKISDLKAKARRMKELYGIGLIVIDYLQLLSGSRGSYNPEHRQNEISEISRNLKTLARELNVPIICLSQLSRKVEERPGHRPQLSDLRESGSIEQDADIVMFIYRAEYYDAKNKPGTAEILIAKNRHGPTGDITLSYRKEIAQFNNYTGAKEGPKAPSDTPFAAFAPRS